MVTRLIALFVLTASLLPLAALIPGGETDPAYAARLADWALGFALCAGVGALAAYLRHVKERAGVPVAAPLPSPTIVTGPAWRFPLALTLASFALYAVVARWVFSARPLLVDEIVYVLQARMYAAGDLWQVVRQPREFFSILHVIDSGVREFGQYPLGGPAMLVPGVWLGATWLVGPAVGALSVALFWRLLRLTDPLASITWRRSTAVLFAVAPFGVFTFASHMNHATTLLWLLAATIALPRAVSDTPRAPLFGLLAGLGLGVAATIRPLDAVAFALPVAGWLLWNARRGARQRAALALAGVGVALPVAVMLAANAATTGEAFTFGYDLLWGSGHGLGFHQSPWGPVHTPARGVELIGLYFARLGTYLYETPFPAILPVAAGLWLARSLSPLDRYLLAAAGFLLVGYWAYWHDGFFLGPRFLFPLLPLLVLWTARAVPLLRDRLGAASLAWRGVRAAGIFGIAYAVVTVAIVRAPSYRNDRTSMRYDARTESAHVGVRDALVLVQESWGAQLLVRMWGAGIARPEADVVYRNVDSCVLEHALLGIEREALRGDAALERLRPLLADSAQLASSDRSPDTTERMLVGARYPALCEARIAEDRQGFLHLAPWRLAEDGNVYARWLPGREAEIAAAFPDRMVYRLRRASPEPGAALVWEALDRATFE